MVSQSLTSSPAPATIGAPFFTADTDNALFEQLTQMMESWNGVSDERKSRVAAQAASFYKEK